MTGVPILRGERVTLRPVTAADAARWHALGRDPEIHRLYGGSAVDFKPMTGDEAERACRSIMEHPCAWGIVADRLIGHVRLDRIDRRDSRAALVIGIGDPACLGRGFGTEAIGLVLDHAFATMALHRISLRVIECNQRAIRAYQKCGFTIEGRERDAALVDGKRYDDVMMGILATDQRRTPPPHPT